MNPKLTSFCIALIVLFSACKKDDIISGVHSKKITIQLDNQYVTSQKIDSAILISEWPGLSKRVRLQLNDNKLESTLSAFSQTAHKMTVQLFTKTTFNNKPLQFERDIALTPGVSESLLVNGPASFTDPKWKPRVILDYTGGGIRYTAIVALRISDPYFEILHLPQGWDRRITVFRGFYKNDFTNMLHGSTWDCGNVCSGNIVNREAFNHLPSQVNHLDFNKLAIEVGFYISHNTINELAFTYDK
jgi:hypothetical protein